MIQILFENPLLISYELPDTLKITFADQDLFTTDSGIRIPPEHRQIERKLMRQLPPDSQQLQDSIDEAAEGAKNCSIAILITNLFFGFGLQQLFDMINIL